MAITRSQQAKQMLQDGGMLVKPGFGGARQGYRGEGGYQGGPSEAPDDRSSQEQTDNTRSAIADAQRSQRIADIEKFIDRPTFGLTGEGRFNLFAGPPRGFDDPVRDGRGEIPLWMQLGYSSEEDYNRATGTGIMNPGAVQPQQTMDLNRIAYRLMADGGFLEDTDEARQAYGLGSIVKKAFKTVRKPFKAVTKTLKKVAKSPTGRLLLAVAAPYALGPMVASSAALSGLTAAQQAALISAATTGITQVASGEDLNFKDIALSAAIGGVTASAFPPGGQTSSAAATSTSAPFTRPTMADVGVTGMPSVSAAPRSIGSIQDYGSAINVSSPVRASASTSASRAFTRPSMADVGVTGMPSVKPTLSERLLAPGRRSLTRGLAAIKDSKLTDVLLRGKDGKISPLKLSLLGGTLAGLATAKGVGQEETEEMDRGPGIDIPRIRRSPFDYFAPRFGGSEFDFYGTSAADGGRIGYQKGSKEPVAKKVMPLLDMGGMEKDYRAEGGFVPIGRMEKADDVPARLSKNEFVFTADAVRNAGDGDVDKGAEVMYNMMKNLEAGGEVSEESQGLEGARQMFKTSQRLEEVL